MSRATEVARSATVWVGVPGADEPWKAIELDGAAFALTAEAGEAVRFLPLQDARELLGRARTAVSVLARGEGLEAWCLLGGGPGLRVNGEPLLAGARVLRNRDEIALGRSRFYFTTERRGRAERFAAVGRPVPCARCDVPLADGELAVRCPNASCGLWYHHVVAAVGEDAAEARKQSCWETADVCAGCQQPTSLDPERRWVPEE